MCHRVVAFNEPFDVGRAREAVKKHLASSSFESLDAAGRVASLRRWFSGNSRQAFFNEYQVARVGRLNAAVPVPDCDDDASTNAKEKEARHEEENHAGNEFLERADDCMPDEVDKERDQVVTATTCPLWSARPLASLRMREQHHGSYTCVNSSGALEEECSPGGCAAGRAKRPRLGGRAADPVVRRLVHQHPDPEGLKRVRWPE